MSVSITAVTLQGTTAFEVAGTTSASGKQVTSQAFIGQTAASSEGSTTSGADRTWSLTLTLNAEFQEAETYRVRATCEDGDSAEVSVPPFFGPGRIP